MTESILVESGAKRTKGAVDAGTTTTDYLQEERERGVTIQSACVTVNWNDAVLNLYDTPGHAEFGFEVERVLPALDLCLLVLDGSKGVEAQTKTVLRAARKRNLPLIAFVNKMDKQHANFEKCLKSMSTFNLEPLVLRSPEAENYWDSDEVHENLSMLDDNFAELYLEGNISRSTIDSTLQNVISSQLATPVFSGAAKKSLGVPQLLDYLSLLAHGEKLITNSSKLARCFKITSHPRLGQLNLFRNFSMESDKNRVKFRNVTAGHELGSYAIHSLQGDDVVAIPKLVKNQIFVIPGDLKINTGDVIAIKTKEAQVSDMTNDVIAPAHSCSALIETEKASDLGKLRNALKLLTRQDPSISYEIDEDGQVTLRGVGKFHIEVTISRLKNEHKVKNLVMWPIQVDFREQPAENLTVYETMIIEGMDPIRMTLEIEQNLEKPKFDATCVKISDSCFLTADNSLLKSKKLNKQLGNWVKDAVMMSSYNGPIKKCPVTNCVVKVARIEVSDEDSIRKIADNSPMLIIRGVIQAMRRAFEKVEFDIIEPIINYELNIYDRNYVQKARQVLTTLECEIFDEVEDADMDVTTIHCSCKGTGLSFNP